jgi:hypothetical protein
MVNPNPEAAAAGVKNYWAKMTPEERSTEMVRRQRVAALRRNRKLKGSQAERDRWREAKKKSRTAQASTDSPFPPELMKGETHSVANGKSSSHTITIRERLLAIEAAVSALKADLGL